MTWRKRVLRLFVRRPRPGDELIAYGYLADRLRLTGAHKDVIEWTEEMQRQARRRIEVWS